MITAFIRWLLDTCARIDSARVIHRDRDGRRQVFVDVSTIARDDAGTGIQRVVRALWLELKSMEDPTLSFTPVIASRKSGYRVAPDDFLCNPVVSDLNKLAPAVVTHGDIFLGLDLAAHIVPSRARDLRRWQARGVELAFVVYDLLPARYPQWFSIKGRRNYLRWINFVLRNADQVICIAETVRRDLDAWMKTEMPTRRRQPRIALMRLSGDISASSPSKGLPTTSQEIFAWISASPTILMVGTIEPRKGYDQALAAFERLWADSIPPAPKLLIVGRRGWMTDILQQRIREHPEHDQRLMWLENVSDEFLEGIYARSYGLLFASRAEGFGLPLLEAATHGKPALSRDLPVFREFAPSNVTFFDTESSDNLAVDITDWMGRPNVSESGLAPSPVVRWPETARDLVKALGLTVV